MKILSNALQRRLCRSMCGAWLALCAGITATFPARAGEIYTQNFDSYAGTQNANQTTTGLPVAFGGTIAGWNRAGDGAIHAVRLATGNWAPMFYDGNTAGGNNIITTNALIASANTTSATYRVSFQVAPAVYSQSNQATTASDAVILTLLQSNNSTVISSGTFFPGAFVGQASSGNLPFQSVFLDYQGTGSDSGGLNLRFAANNPGAQRFGGAVDNVVLQTTARWNNGTSGTWSTGSNWLSGAAPVNTDLVLIGGNAGGTSTNDISALTAAGIEFMSGAGSFTVSGSAITLSAGVTNASASNQTLALDLVLGGTTRTFATNNAAARLTVSGAISDGAGAAGITKTGSGTLVLGGVNTYTGTTTISAGVLSISSTAALPGWNTAGKFSVASGATLAISNDVDSAAVGTLAGTGNFAAGSTLGFDTAAGDRTVSSAITGGLALAKVGGNILTLSASNAYTGGTLVSAGQVTLGNPAALGTGTATISGGVLDLGNQTIANPVVLTSGTLTGGSLPVSQVTPTAGTIAATLTGGTLTKSGAGTLVLAASNSYTGGTQLNAGMVSFAANALGPSGAVTMNGGGLQWASGNTQDISGRLVLVNSTTATFNTNNNNVVLANAFGNTASALLVKSGSGTLTLSASNSYTGGTRIDAGTVSFAANALGPSGAVTMNGGGLQWASGNTQDISSGGRLALVNAVNANFDTNGNNVTLGTAFTLSGGSNGGFTKLGTGTLTLTASNAFTGYAHVTAGTLEFANNALGNTASALIPMEGGTLRWAAGNTQDVSNRLSLKNGATATVDTNGNNVAFASSIGGSTSGILAKSGLGILTLSAANTYTGGTRLNGGVLALGSANALSTSGTISFGGGTLQFSSANTTDYSSRFSTAAGQAYSLDTNGQNVSVGTALSSSGGSLTKSGLGALTLSAANGYAGDTIIKGGTLKLASAGSLANSARIIVGDAASDGAVLDLTDKTSFSIGASQTLMGKGTALLGANTSLTVAGLFSPGNSPGLFTYDGGSTTLSGTTLMEIWGTSRGTNPGYDAVNVINSGLLTLGGILQLNFNQSFADNASFTLFDTLTSGSLAGGFTGITITGSSNDYVGLSFTQAGNVWTTGFNGNNQGLRLTQTASNVTLDVIVVPEPAAIALLASAALTGWAAWKRRRALRTNANHENA